MDCLICRKSQAIWGNILERGILMLKENYAKTGNGYRSVDGVNAFKYYGYYDGVLYARITWEKGTIYVPPGQTVSTESGRIFPLRKNCEIQVDSYGLPICYKLKNI